MTPGTCVVSCEICGKEGASAGLLVTSDRHAAFRVPEGWKVGWDMSEAAWPGKGYCFCSDDCARKSPVCNTLWQITAP